VLNILSKGSVFEKAKTLREKQHIVRDNGDNLYFEFINVRTLVPKPVSGYASGNYGRHLQKPL
jgi:hypothetical protein